MNTGKKWLLGIAACGALAAAAVGVGYFIKAKLREQYLSGLSPEDAKSDVLAGKLKDMKPEERKAVLRKASEKEGQSREIMRAENLSDGDRDIVRTEMGQIREEQMKARVNEYFALAEAERPAYLDKMIDDMAKRFAEYAERRRQEQASAGGQTSGQDAGQNQQSGEQRQWRGPTMSRIKERIESGTPEERAKQAQFRKEMFERMRARGMGPPGR